MTNVKRGFAVVQFLTWLALVLALLGSIRNVAWSFSSIAGPGSEAWGYVQAAGVDIGLVAMALGMQLRRKADRPVGWLRFGALMFSVISAGANAMHGYAHASVAAGVPAWLLLARPWALGAMLPAMVFVLSEVAGHGAERALGGARKDAQVTDARRNDSDAVAHTETGNAPAPYRVCSVCGYSALTQQAYAGHSRKHAPVAPDNGAGNAVVAAEAAEER